MVAVTVMAMVTVTAPLACTITLTLTLTLTLTARKNLRRHVLLLGQLQSKTPDETQWRPCMQSSEESTLPDPVMMRTLTVVFTRI